MRSTVSLLRPSLPVALLVAPVVASVIAALPGRALAGWETRDVAGVDTRIYTPASVSPIGEGRALMVGLHGCNQTADDLRQYGNLEAAADAFGVVIALPNVPGGGVFAGCWSYYGPVHSRDSGHSGPVIEMVESLVADEAHGIDPAQVYLAGFSAGGGQAVVLGCLAPDLFAGVGVAAGPAVGTNGDQIPQVGTTAMEAAALCETLAGTHAGDFATQLAVAFTDTQDFVVAQGYAELNAKMFAQLTAGGVEAMTAAPIDVAALPGAVPVGEGTTWADAEGPRIAWIVSTGVGHAWPAGSGSAAGALAFVSGTGIDFSYVLAEFFTDNNRRVGGEWGDDGGGSEGGDTDGEDDAGPTSGGDGSGESEGTAQGSGPDSDDGGEDDALDETTSGPAADGYVEPTGCQCRTRNGTPTAPALLLLGAIALRRRRARRLRRVTRDARDARPARGCAGPDRCAPARAGRGRPRP